MGTIALGASIAVGLVGFGIAIGQGLGLSKGLEGMAKQPEAGNLIRTAMIVGMAIMETMGVLSFVIAIILTSKL